MSDSVKEIWNYVLSAILLVAGFLFLSMYTSSQGLEKQPVEMLLGAVFLIVAGILALPIVARFFRKGLAFVIGLVCLGAAGFLLYSLYDVINKEIVYQDDFADYREVTKQRLKDIRTAQEEYAKFHGYYASEWDSLIEFIDEPVIPKEYRVGDFIPRRGEEEGDTIPNGLMEEYAERGLVLKRSELDSVAAQKGVTKDFFVQMIRDNETAYRIVDTSYVSVREEYFDPAFREAKGLPALDMKELPYNPHPKSGKKFLLKTGTVESGDVAGIISPVILVKDPAPFGREGVRRDTLMFGSLTEPKTDGNWSRE